MVDSYARRGGSYHSSCTDSAAEQALAHLALVPARADPLALSSREIDHDGHRRLDDDAIGRRLHADEAVRRRRGAVRPREIPEPWRHARRREAGLRGRDAEDVLDEVARRRAAPAVAVGAVRPELGPRPLAAREEVAPVAAQRGDAV